MKKMILNIGLLMLILLSVSCVSMLDAGMVAPDSDDIEFPLVDEAEDMGIVALNGGEIE